jgi:flagellar FliL protein
MADKEKEEETQEESQNESKKGSNKTLIIIIIAVLLLIIIIGGVAAFMLMGDDEEAVEQSAPLAKERPSKRVSKHRSSADFEDSRSLKEIGVLYPLDTFTVNLKSDSGRRYLKVTMSLELEGEELSMELDSKTAVLRDKIIRILTSKTLEEVTSKKGKQKISEQIMDTLNAMITDGTIKGIYFTEFVIQ